MADQPERFREDSSRRSRIPAISPASLLLVGTLLGFAASLSYAWLLSPVVYVGVSPARLSERDKSEYIYLVAESFAAGSSWEQTQFRLASLGESDIGLRVETELDQAMREGRPAYLLRNLAQMADHLDVQSPGVSVFVPRSPATLSSDAGFLDSASTPAATRPSILPAPTQTPSREPTSTPLPVYRLLRQEKVCLASRSTRLIQVQVVDSLLEPLAGAEIFVNWDGGEDRFFTGFQPELGLGYADFLMEEGVAYRVSMADGSPVVGPIEVEACDEVGERLGGWRLTFQNSDVIQESP